jgi:hypothetical protein
MRMRRTIVSAFLFAACATADDSGRGAKEIFFDPNGSPGNAAVVEHGRRVARVPRQGTTPQTIGLSYWIELMGSDAGSGTAVTDERVFRSGERIRLHFRGNTDGRIMILQIGSSARASILFPDAAKGLSDDLLRANRERILPASTHWFRFDDTPGIDKLVVVFGTTQADIDRYVPTHRVMDERTTASLIRLAEAARGGKDLLIETESRKPEEIGRYVVSLSRRPFAFVIDLRHE